MAIKVAQTTGDWSTDAIWYTGTDTEAALGSAIATSSTRYSKVFTAPNTTNACTGAIVWFGAIGTAAHSVKVELEEYDGVSAWVSKAEHTITDTHTVFDNNRLYSGGTTVLSMPVYFKFDTPYVYTTTTAGYYRFKLSGGNSATTVYPGTSGSTTILYAVIVDNRTGVPASGDNIYIVGDESTETVLTLDSSLQIGGSVGSESANMSYTPVNNKAITHGYNGKLKFRTTASTTLTVEGEHLIANGGSIEIGTTASPYPADYQATIIYNAVTTYGFGSYYINLDTTKANISLVGAAKAYKLLYASGTGAAADPLVVTGTMTGWKVGDRIWVSSGTYNELENRYIVAKATNGTATITNYGGTVPGTVLVTDTAHGLLTGMKVDIAGTTDYNGTGIAVTVVDANSYYFTDTYTSDQVGTWAATTTGGLVLSASAGGAVSALSNSHATTDWVLNSSRNVKLQGETPGTTFFYGYHYITSDTGGIYKNVEIDGPGGTSSSRAGWFLTASARQAVNMDNCALISRSAISSVTNTVLNSVSSGVASSVIKDTIVVGHYNNYALPMASLQNNAGTYQNIYVLGSLYGGFYLAGNNVTYDNLHVRNSVVNYTTTNAYGGLIGVGGDNVKVTNSTVNSCRGHAVQIRNGCTNMKFIDCAFGTINDNSASGQIGVGDLGYSTAVFDTCDFSASTLFYESAGAVGVPENVPGSYYAFQHFDTASENGKCRWYQPYGIAYKCGTDMEDTTTSPEGDNCLRIDPTNSTIGFIWEFRILATPNQAINVLGKLKKDDEATSDTATVELFLPGSTTADDTVTMPNGTDWNAFALGATYSGTYYGWATVRITCKSTTSGASFYIGDLYNGTNDITNMSLWHNGKPSEIMFEQLGDPNAVWAVLTSGQTTAGTMGKNAVDTKKSADTAIAVAAS